MLDGIKTRAPATGDFHYSLTDVGAYTMSSSPYETFDQGGNTWEWNDSLIVLLRGIRGSAWNQFSASLAADHRTGQNHLTAFSSNGLRLARTAVPGDFTNDGEVGLEDYDLLQVCITGPIGDFPQDACHAALFRRTDSNDDEHVDLREIAEFQRLFTGP